MEYERIVQAITTGAEHWKVLKGQQYKLKLPDGVYSSDLMNCALLSGVPCEESTLGEQIVKAAEILASLKKDERVRKHLAMATDVPAILALATLIAPPPATESVEIDLSAAEQAEDIEVSEVEPTEDIQEAERQLEPCPACGFGSPDYQPPEPKETLTLDDLRVVHAETGEELETLDTSEVSVGQESSSVPFEPKCAHVGSDGCCARCTGEPTTDCSGCEESIVVASCERCADHEDDECESIFCVDCAKESLNERGFCEECEFLECDSCGEDFDNGTETQCKGDECEDDYCDSCARDVLNVAGFCSDCSGEEDLSCDGCGEDFIESRTTRCKGEDCEMDFCAGCKEARLDTHQHCADCARDRRNSLQ